MCSPKRCAAAPITARPMTAGLELAHHATTAPRHWASAHTYSHYGNPAPAVKRPNNALQSAMSLPSTEAQLYKSAKRRRRRRPPRESQAPRPSRPPPSPPLPPPVESSRTSGNGSVRRPLSGQLRAPFLTCLFKVVPHRCRRRGQVPDPQMPKSGKQ